MEQQQFRVSFSLGTKLLISVVLLLAIVITFLNFSTIVLMTDDKRAYTFQAQSTEATLIGKEFLNTARLSIESLRLVLTSIDPTRLINSENKNAALRRLKELVQNQGDLISIELGLIDKETGNMKESIRDYSGKLLSLYKLQESQLTWKAEELKSILPDLVVNGFTFLNGSQLGLPPLLIVIVADLQNKDYPQGIPAVIGFVNMANASKEIRSESLTVANRYGRILFDTDPDRLLVRPFISDDPLYMAAQSVQFSNGVLEYELKGEEFLGSYYKPGLNLVVLNRTKWRKAMQATYSLIERFILLGSMAIGVAIIFAILFSKTVTAPLQNLYQATKAVAMGNFNINLKTDSKDEIGALTDSFNLMSKQINELILEKVERVYLENELAIASMVQQTLIPPGEYTNDRIEVHSVYQSASQCGGDWWGFFMEQDRFCVMIADATGHGLPSALITASARSCFSIMQKLAEEEEEFSFSPSSMLAYANRVVHDSAQGQIMMTFFVGILDFKNKTLTYSSAGHNPPWLFKKEGDGYQLKSLIAQGNRLGEALRIPDYEEKTIGFDAEDILFLYTDGLTEGKNLESEMFGKKKTRKIVEANLKQGPQMVVQELMKEVREHNKGKAFDDDITIACAKIKTV